MLEISGEVIQKVSSCLNGLHEKCSVKCKSMCNPHNRKAEKRVIAYALGEQDEIWRQIHCPQES